MSQVLGDDNIPVPQGFIVSPALASLQVAASIALTTPSTATIVTDADGWGTVALDTGGPNSSNFVVDTTAGTVTVPRAMTVRVSYQLSSITGVNNQVITTQIFGGASAATAKGGICINTQPATAVGTVIQQGTALFTCVAGDVIAIKVIASTGNFTCAAGCFTVEEI